MTGAARQVLCYLPGIHTVFPHEQLCTVDDTGEWLPEIVCNHRQQSSSRTFRCRRQCSGSLRFAATHRVSGLCELFEKPHLAFGRTVPARPVGTKRTERSLSPRGSHAETLHEGRAVCLDRDARIVVNILDDRSRLVQGCPTRDARFSGKPAAFPESTHGIFLRIVDLVGLTQNEGGAISTNELSHGSTETSSCVGQALDVDQLTMSREQGNSIP